MNLELHATPDDVMRAVEALQAFGREQQLEERPLFGLALALEECGSNIVNHALQRDPLQMFRVTIQRSGEAIVIELRDRGPEFDPTQAPGRVERPDDPDSATGGWGILLARRFTDEIHYVREQGENVLRLIKRMTQPK